MKSTNLFVDETNKQYTILIGKNKLENDTLIRNSEPNDLWFHLDNMSSPHIVLKTNGDLIPKKYINSILSLFPLHKSGLKFTKFKVIYTEIKNIQLTRIPGTVIPSNVRTINS